VHVAQWLARCVHLAQEHFSHLGPLQLAVVARSLVMEALPVGAKTTPTAESVYIVSAAASVDSTVPGVSIAPARRPA